MVKRLAEGISGRVGIVALGLVVVLGGFALVGCGGGADENGAPSKGSFRGSNILSIEEIGPNSQDEVEAESQDAAETAEKDELEDGRKHWFTSKEVFNDETETGVRSDGSPLVHTYNSTSSYERNKNGDIITETTRTAQSSNDSDKSAMQTDTVLEYESDEHGWPLTMRRTSTDTFTYVDEDGEEQTDASDLLTSSCTYTYRYDSEGRVVKGSCSDPWRGSLELSYHSNGAVAASTWSHYEQGYSDEGTDDEQTKTYITTRRFDDAGTCMEYVDVTKEGSRSETRTVVEYDEKGSPIRETGTTTKPDGETQTYTIEMTHTEDAQGNIAKGVSTVKGDGKAEHIVWMRDSLRYVEVFLPDGSITRSKLDYDENFNEVLSDTETFDGPYQTDTYSYDREGKPLGWTAEFYDGSTSTAEYDYDARGNLVKWTSTARDGTVRTESYDADGNVSASESSTGSDSKPSNTHHYEWTYVKNPSDFQAISSQCALWGWE